MEKTILNAVLNTPRAFAESPLSFCIVGPLTIDPLMPSVIKGGILGVAAAL
jgi:hypothetical protein